MERIALCLVNVVFNTRSGGSVCPVVGTHSFLRKRVFFLSTGLPELLTSLKGLCIACTGCAIVLLPRVDKRI